MNLRIEQSGGDFLVIDPSDPAVPVDVYPTRAEAENFLQFIGQTDLSIPVPEVSEDLLEKL